MEFSLQCIHWGIHWGMHVEIPNIKYICCLNSSLLECSPDALTNQSLLFLAWPPRPPRLEAAPTLAVVISSSWAWETRDLPLKVKIDLAAAGDP